MCTTNTTPAVSDLYTVRGVTVKLYTVPGGFIVGAVSLVTGATAIERLADFADIGDACTRVEFAVRAAAM